MERVEFEPVSTVLKQMGKAQELLHQIGITPPGPRQKIMSKLLPNVHKTAQLRYPFALDLGINIYIGSQSIVNYNATLLDMAPIRIGERVLIGPNCTLITPMHSLKASERTGARGYALSITIHNDVWLGSNVTVFPGVTIGEGAVVGTGSLVTKDVPPYTLVYGNPAKEIRKLTK